MRATSRSAGCRGVGRGYGNRGTKWVPRGVLKMLKCSSALPLRERRWKATRRRTHPLGLSYIVGGISSLRGEGIWPRAVGVWAPPTPKPSSAPPRQNFRDSKRETKDSSLKRAARRTNPHNTKHCSKHHPKPLRASTKSRTAGWPHRVTAHSLARSHIDRTRQFRASRLVTSSADSRERRLGAVTQKFISHKSGSSHKSINRRRWWTRDGPRWRRRPRRGPAGRRAAAEPTRPRARARAG